MIRSKTLAEEAQSVYTSGKELAYNHVTRDKVVLINKSTETRINIKFGAQRRSLKAILLLFMEEYTGGARDSEKYVFPDLTKDIVTINGSSNMIYSNGIEGKDMWEDAHPFFVKEKSKIEHMNLSKFYTDNKFGLVIDMRSMASQAMHGSGTRIVNSTDGVQLEIERGAKGSGVVNCHIFVISDSKFNIMNKTVRLCDVLNMSMDPSKIPFNVLTVGPTNSGKSSFVVEQLYGPFRFKSDNIVLICPTFAYNKTYHRIGENDPRMFVLICEHHNVEKWLNRMKWLFEGTNTLIIPDDCAVSKDVKGRTCELVNLAFSGRQFGICVWVLTQNFTAISHSFRMNAEVIVLFYTPSAKSMKAIFEDYAGELSQNEFKGLISKLKEREFSHLVFWNRSPYGIKLIE